MSLARRKSIRILAAVLAVLLVGAVAIKLLLPADKIRDLALNQARQALGRDVSVGAVTVSLRGGLGVRLADFAIANPDGFDGAALLTARSLDLKLELKPLFKGAFRVDRLVIEQPEVHLIRRADGRDNFTFASPGPTAEAGAQPTQGASTAPPALSVARLSLTDGSLFFAAEGVAAPGLQSLQLTGLNLGLSLSDPDPGHYDFKGRLSAGSISLIGPAAVPELSGTVDFDLSWDSDSAALDLKMAKVQVLDLPMACTGRITMVDGGPRGAIEARASDITLTDLARLLPPELAAKLSPARDSGTLAAEVNLELTGEQAVPLVFSGTVAVKDADLALAQPFLPPGQKGKLAGRGECAVSFSGEPGRLDALQYQGTAIVRGVSFTKSGLVDDLLNLDATIAFTPDEVVVESSQAEFAAGTINLTGKMKDPWPYFLPPELQQGAEPKIPHLAFNLQTAKLDVDRWLPAASPAGRSQSDPTKASSATPRRIPDGLEFPDLTCAGTFTADTLLYMQVPLTAVHGKVSLKDRRLSVHDVTGAVYHGTVAGQMDVDLNDLQDPAYEGTYQASNIEVDDFATRFAGLAGIVFGGCNLKGRFGANGLDPEAIRNSLTLKADAGLAHGRVVTSGSTYQALNKLAAQAGQSLNQEQDLRDLATHIRVSEGRVHLDALTSRLGQFGDVKLDGYYGFNGDLAYQGSLLLTAAQTDDLFSGGLLGELGKLLGSQRPQRLELPLSVDGTRTKPQVKLDLSGVMHELQQRVAEEQGDKLEQEAKRKLGDLLQKWK